ncbi:MAG: tetratricopeptide repeat protein [Isosphaeraceae bacterium]
MPPKLNVAIINGKAECQSSQGEYAKAIDLLKGLLTREPKNADVAAKLAELEFHRGNWEAADAAVKQALVTSGQAPGRPARRGGGRAGNAR